MIVNLQNLLSLHERVLKTTFESKNVSHPVLDLIYLSNYEGNYEC